MTDNNPPPAESRDARLFIEMFENSEAPTALISPELRVIWANRAAIALSSCLALPDGLAQLLAGDLERHSASLGELSAPITLRSVPSRLAVHLTPLSDKTGYLANISPITDMGAPLKNQQAMATAISGQLRRPLHHIYASISSLRQLFMSDINPELYDFVESVNQNAYKLLRATHNLTQYFGPPVDSAGAPPVRTDLSDTLHSALRAAAVITSGVGLPLNWQLPDTPLYVAVSEQTILAALMQIISNSCRFTRQGNSIEVTLSRRGCSAVITVSDHGPGIPESALGQVFEPFFSYDHTGLPYGGLGLGLTIARSAVMQLGGRIALSSREDEGTTVVITLPLCEDESLMLESPQSTVDYLRDRFSLIHLLLSDSCGCPAP